MKLNQNRIGEKEEREEKRREEIIIIIIMVTMVDTKEEEGCTLPSIYLVLFYSLLSTLLYLLSSTYLLPTTYLYCGDLDVT